MIISQSCCVQLTDKLVDKVGVQRTPHANPENYSTGEYSEHIKGDNSVHKRESNQETPGQRERELAGEICLPPSHHKCGRLETLPNLHLMLGIEPLLAQTQAEQTLEAAVQLICMVYCKHYLIAAWLSGQVV